MARALKALVLFVLIGLVYPMPIPGKRDANPYNKEGLSCVYINAFFFIIQQTFTVETLYEVMDGIREFLETGSTDLSSLALPANINISHLQLDQPRGLSHRVAWQTTRAMAVARLHEIGFYDEPETVEIHTVGPPIELPQLPDDVEEYPRRCVSKLLYSYNCFFLLN